MLTLNYSPDIKADTVLLGDSQIDEYLIGKSTEDLEINISQISIVYVLRKLIALNKIDHKSVRIKTVDDNIHHLTSAGRFTDQYPSALACDLFDTCLDAILQ